jgi:hypothetical protein
MTAKAFMYRTELYSNKITRLEVRRVTAKRVVSVQLNWRNEEHETTEARESTWHAWHDTWGQAHAYLLARAEEAVKQAKAGLQKAQDILGNVKGMKETLP